MIFPEGCIHWNGGNAALNYQRRVYDAALASCTNRRTAVDVGAHVGIFTRRMEADFETVLAFEPAPPNFACLKQNCHKALLFNCGLASIGRPGWMKNPAIENSGAWMEMTEGVEVRMLALDDFRLTTVDLVKLDIQGGEGAALRGMEETLRYSKPVVVVEIMSDTKAEIAHILGAFGYRMKCAERDDQVWVAS